MTSLLKFEFFNKNLYQFIKICTSFLNAFVYVM